MLSRVRFGAHRGHRVGRSSTQRLPILCRRSARGDEGAALVEFALVLPIFMAIVMGLFTGGLAYNHKQDITAAVREAGRFGATLPMGQCSVSSPCSGGYTTWASFVRSIAQKRSNGVLSNSDICVALVKGAANSPQLVDLTGGHSTSASYCFVDDATSSTDLGARVQVSATHNGDTIAVFFVPVGVTLSSQGATDYESS